MNTVFSLPQTRYHFTPQIGKNRKSHQIQKITRRISLLKYQVQKQKRESSQDQIRLKQINSLSESFSKKLLQEIQKCKELKSIGLETDKNLILDNLRTQNQNKTLKSNKNLYNSKCLNSKTKLNSHIIANQTQSSNKLSLNVEQKKEGNEVRMKSLYVKKGLNLKDLKNVRQNQKSSNFYLKETFLTSIIFILLGTVFRLILSTV